MRERERGGRKEGRKEGREGGRERGREGKKGREREEGLKVGRL